jgi:soluble epoxide hydrolase/lipid-phosphate phosphatase
MTEKIIPNDSRVRYKKANLNGINYSYILSEPQDEAVGTVFLIHGWPDLAYGWRYQILSLTSLGLRVVVPNMMGYAETDAPDHPSYYTLKRAADDIATLAEQLGVASIILGGHDWGGVVVFRVALHYPNLVSAIFSVSTPFFPPTNQYKPVPTLPNFKYQLQLRGPDVEDNIVGHEKLKQFLNGMYEGRSRSGQPFFSPVDGCYLDRLEGLNYSPLLNKEEMDYYVESYAIHGMHGPLNWYRTGELNFVDEINMANDFENFKIEIPVLFIACSKDTALPPWLSTGMDKWFKSLTRAEVDASHWAMWEKPAEVNKHIHNFLSAQFCFQKTSSL